MAAVMVLTLVALIEEVDETVCEPAIPLVQTENAAA